MRFSRSGLTGNLSKHVFWWSVLLVSLATFFLFGPVWRGEMPLPTRSIPGIFWGQSDQPAQASIFRDRMVQSYPYHLFAATTIQSGRWPLWNNLIFAGTPFFANGQAGILSPFKFPWWWLPPWLSFIIVTLLQSIVAGAGMIMLGKKLGWSRVAQIISALALTLSAHFVMRLTVTTMSAVIACLPWIMWSILKLHERLSWKWVMITAMLLTAAVLAGHVQLAAMVIGYAAVWALRWWRRAWPGRRIIMMGLAFAFGVGLAAVQLVPIKQVLDQAYRQPAHLTWSEVLKPKNLFQASKKNAAGLATLVDQNMLGNEAHYRGPANYLEGNLYIGPMAILALIASLGWWRKKIWRWLAGLTIWQTGLLIFPGWWLLVGKIAPWLTVTPVWRTSFFLIVSLSLLAGFGADYVLARRSKRIQWGIVGVTVLISLWQWQGILPFSPRATLFPPNNLLSAAADLTVVGSRLWTPNGTLDQFMPANIPVIEGYDSVYPHSYLELMSANAELRRRNQLHVKDPSPPLLDVTGANFMITSSPLDSGWRAITTSGSWTLAVRAVTAKPIHTVTSLVPEKSPDQLSTIDVRHQALISGPLPAISATAHTSIKTFNRLATDWSWQVATDAPTVMVTNLQYYPGWRLMIDNHMANPALLKVNHAFIGVAVPRGDHQVVLQYRPSSLWHGIIISLLSLMLMLLAPWLGPRSWRKQKTA